MNRRNFLSQSTALSGGLLFSTKAWAEKLIQPKFQLPADFSIKILATNWGFQGSWDEFCANVKADGFDGIEVWFPGDEANRIELFAALEKYELEYGFLAGSGSRDFETHYEQFQKAVEGATAHKPLFINCHAGKDYFTYEQGKQIIDFTTKKMAQTSVPIYHETHRGRLLFAAHIAKNYIEQLPDLRLTLDISHWCNVHESLLQDQSETVDLALERTEHIHSRVGHPEGPQVNDPRAPEWERAVQAHFAWWDKVVERKAQEGGTLTMTTEFGPPHYLPAVPYTQQPLADQWGINVHMMQLWRERYK